MDDNAFYASANAYDLFYSHGSNVDVTFWCDLRRRLGARRVLELGCGTGRVTLPLAATGQADGVMVVGLDRAPAMLAAAQARLDQATPGIQAAVRLVVGDMRDFTLGETYDLVLVPFNTLGHLLTLDDQRACFAAVQRHLSPGGHCAVAVVQPSLDELRAAAELSAALEVDSGIVDPATGEHVVRYRRQSYKRHTQTLATHFVVERLSTNGEVTTTETDLRLHVYTSGELARLFAVAGLTVTATYGAYDRAPFDSTSAHLIIVGRAG